MSWQRAWEEGRTPWDAGGSPPILEQLVDDDALPTGRALVPGCGSGYDVLTLARHPDRSVLGIDLSPIAQDRFAALRDAAGLPRERARVAVADFFADRLSEEPLDLVWDYTFLCALEPEARPAWAARMDEILAPGGELVTLIFPVHPKPLNPGGPPYPMTPELVRGLLEPQGFEPRTLEPVARSHPARQGKEWLGRWRRRRS